MRLKNQQLLATFYFQQKKRSLSSMGKKRHLITFVFLICLEVASWLFIVAVAAAMCLVKTETLPDAGDFADAIEAVSDLELVAVILAACQPVLHGIRGWLTDSKLWIAVQSLLDEYQSVLFLNINSEKHHSRVTLFKHQSCILRFGKFWGGWLVSVKRSGHTTKNSKRFYKAPDDADKAEGIAGLTWARNRITKTDELSPPVEGKENYLDNLKKYADSTRLSVDQVKEKKPKAKYYLGIPIKVGEKIWVVVIDSRDEKIKTDRTKEQRLFVETLSEVLKAGKL